MEEKEQPQGVRRSARTTKRIDYKVLNSGSNQLLSTGDTVVSEHMALNDHQEGDIRISILDFEQNWFKRTTKETIAINRIKPTLNGSEGHHLSAIYDVIPSKFNRGLVLPRPLSKENKAGIHNNTNSTNLLMMVEEPRQKHV